MPGCAISSSVDESRLRVRLYLHEGLDLEAANRAWSNVTGIPIDQFGKPYRAVPDPSIRTAKHIYGCVVRGLQLQLGPIGP